MCVCVMRVCVYVCDMCDSVCVCDVYVFTTCVLGVRRCVCPGCVLCLCV